MVVDIVNSTFSDMLERDYTPRVAVPLERDPPPVAWVETLAGLLAAAPHPPNDDLRLAIEALIAEIDLAVDRKSVV